MIKVSQAYKQASESSERKSYVVAKYGLYNKKAKSQIESVTSEYKPFSNINKLYNDITNTNYNYISCEPNRCKLDGTFYFVNDKTKVNEREKIAYWSNSMSSENAFFQFSPKISFKFSEPIENTEITLSFQEAPKNFNVSFYLESYIVGGYTFSNNTSLIVETKDSFYGGKTHFDTIQITFNSTNEPYRYIKMNEIDLGVVQKFTNEQIADFQIIDELSIDSSELSANFLSLSIKNLNGEYDILNPNNKLGTLQEKQEITLYHYLKVGEKYQELPLGTFLIKKFLPKKQVLEIEAYDDIYYMNQIYYGSKFYRDVEIKVILEDLFNYFNYTNYIIDDELDGIKLTGYLPQIEWREALRLICEAGCCVASKTREGKTYIYKTYDPSVKKFTKKLLFDEEPTKNLFNDAIDIVEYNYTNVEENVEIYSSELDVGVQRILYSNYPIEQDSVVKSDESNANYEIIERYATSCVVNVIAKTNVILKGTLIKETSTIVSNNKNTNSENENYTIEIKNNLITSINSKQIVNWKLGRKDVKFNFNTLVVPYIEVGDTCVYETKYGDFEFIPTRIEFTKSILQNIEGE